MGPKFVTVPRSKGPLNVCWSQWSGQNPYFATVLGIDPMEHCTLAKGHFSPHTWELPVYRNRGIGMSNPNNRTK
jgi:hypothetical protein